MKKTRISQAIVEYVILTAVIFLAVVATSFIDDIRNAFRNHFQTCKAKILEEGY